jgi:arsenite-transporting ATPase
VHLDDLGGHPEIALLRRILSWKDLRDSASCDVLVVDGPAVERAVELVGAVQRWTDSVDRFLPLERRVSRALRSAAEARSGGFGSDLQGPDGDPLVDGASALSAALGEARSLWSPSTASVLMVAGPGSAARAEVRWGLMAMTLLGMPATRVLLTGDGTERAPVPGTAAALAEAVAPWPVQVVPRCAEEPLGWAALAALGRSGWPDAEDLDFLDIERADRQSGLGPLISRDGELFVLGLPLPWVEAGEIDLGRRGDELVVRVAGVRRDVPLPAALRRCTVVKAVCRDGRLQVFFEPDPNLWRAL